jgi:LSD1 subclass zinc finger protein
MADTIVRCPDCETRLRVPAGKSAVRCPKCKATVRLDEPEEEEAVELEEVDAVRPKRRRRDDDEDDRPRRMKRRREPEGDGPWVLAALLVPACFVFAFGGAFLFNGTGGLPAGQDGPGGKLFGLGLGFLVSLVLIPLGIVSVKNRHAYGKWGIEVQGGMGVALGMIQAVFGGLIGGFTLYGLIFTLLNGR